MIANIAIQSLIESELQDTSTRKCAHEKTGEELLKLDTRKTPGLWDPIFPKVGVVALAGASDCGKSLFLRQVAISISTGEREFLGFPLNLTNKSVLFVATEDFEIETSMLLKKQASSSQSKELHRLRFIFDTENILDKIDHSLSVNPADLVIIDCFADLLDCDLKDSQKIRAFLSKYKALALKYQCLIIFLHHTSKRTEDLVPSKNNLLSGQGFEAAMRVVLELRVDNTCPDIRHLCIVKANYLPPRFKSESYVLKLDPDSLTFSHTGDRVPFALLAKPQMDETRTKYTEAKALKDSGKTLEEIAGALGYSNRGAISKLLKRGDDSGW